jgi:NADH-quinone oxidoreductase subunit L
LLTIPLALLAVGAVFVGVIAFNWTDSYDGFGAYLLADQDFLHHEDVFRIVPWLMVVSVVLAGGAVLIGWMAYVRGSISHEALATRFATVHRVLVNKYYIDNLYQWVIDKVVLAFGNSVGAFDRIVINDGAVDGPALLVRFSALRARYVQTGRLYNYGLAMTLGVLGLALVWWLSAA